MVKWKKKKREYAEFVHVIQADRLYSRERRYLSSASDLFKQCLTLGLK